MTKRVRYEARVQQKTFDLLEAMVADHEVKSFDSRGELLDWGAVKLREILDERKSMKKAAELQSKELS